MLLEWRMDNLLIQRRSKNISRLSMPRGGILCDLIYIEICWTSPALSGKVIELLEKGGHTAYEGMLEYRARSNLGS